MASELGRTLMESRPKDSTSSPEELLVFGYSCKLFRDNEKAIYLDNGKHLIPWMGDSKLMVDRFDVRGALYDLKEAEAGGGADRWEGMTEEEKAEEEKCDYERYLALYHDEYQQQAYQEEETKRLLAELGSDNYAYSQVGFSYDEQAEVAQQQQQSYVEEQPVVAATEVSEEVEETPSEPDGYFPEKDEDTFVPPPELNVPPGMVVPDTVKQNKIILKTSKFIAAQGGQMEILIKTKQAGNPMFSFLAFDHALNAFYKHTVSMIKSGRYRPADEAEQEKKRRDSEGSEGQYLHPSLSAGIKPDLTPGTPSSLHKPSADCSYSKLINQIKEKQKNNAVVEGIESPGSPSVATLTSSPIATPLPTATTSTPVTAVSTPVVATNSDSIGSVIRKKKKKKDASGWSPEFKGLVDYPSFNQTAENNSDDEGKKDDDSNSNDDSSDDEEEKGDKEGDSVADDLLAPGKANEYSNIKWPPPDVQMVIDKMASYIIKNGEEFESMVRSRSDPRFSFLKTDHEYFPYYRCKMRLYSEVYGDIFKENAEDKGSSSSEAGNSKSTTAAAAAGGTAAASSATGTGAKKDKRVGGKQPSTISFSIKSREQEVNLDRHSTFPVESSSTDDEDMDEEERERRKIEREERRRKRKLKEKEERERREKEEKERREKLEKEKMADKAEESSEASDDNEDVYDIFKYAQEMGGEGESEDPNHNEKYSNGELKKSRNSHKSQSNDNSASEHPERKQQERRMKAAMFLSRLKKSGEDETAAQPVYGPQMPPEIAAQLLNSASQSMSSSSRSSRHSSSRSRSSSPHPGIPMPPQDSPVRPPPPPPVHSPSPVAALNYENEWGSNSEVPVIGDYGEEYTVLKGESSVLSGASEDDRRSQSVEIRSTKSRHVESSHREKARSRKKHRHERSESRSPSSRRDRKKRKRSRSRSRRHKKRRSRSRSHSKSHSKSSHKKKRRKHSSRHDRSERRSKKSRRSVSSSSSDTSELSYSSRSSSPSESEVQVIDSPSQSKRGSRASSVVSVYASDLSILSSGLPRIIEESISAPATPPLPPIPPSPSSRLSSVTQEKLTSDRDSAAEMGNGDYDNEVETVPKEEKKGEKKIFDPQNSAAMAKIAQGLRAKVHALLEKESKL